MIKTRKDFKAKKVRIELIEIALETLYDYSENQSNIPWNIRNIIGDDDDELYTEYRRVLADVIQEIEKLA